MEELNETLIANQLQRLVDAGLFRSAEQLAGYALSQLFKWDQQSTSAIMESFADALCRTGQSRRAARCYRTSRQMHISGGADFIRLTCKIARAMADYEDQNGVARTLADLELELLPVDTLLLLGTACRKTGRVVLGRQALLQALQLEPFALEALPALASMSVLPGDILRAIVAGFRNQKRQCPLWLAELVNAECQAAAANEKEALKHLEHMKSTFSASSRLLCQMGRLHVMQDSFSKARALFERAHRVDEDCVDCMEYYAALLSRENELEDLNRLVFSMKEIAPERPEPWTAAAFHGHSQGELDRAQLFLDKALSLEPSLSLALQLKGKVLLDKGNTASAIEAFEESIRMQKDMDSYRGLVEAQLEDNKLNAALHTARDALEAKPKDTRALVLTGRVLARTTSGAEKAIRVLKKAVSIRPRMEEAVLELAAAYVLNGNHNTAVDTLREALKHVNQSSTLHVRLAGACSMIGATEEALKHYHLAAALDHNNEEARKGIERLEATLHANSTDQDDIDVSDRRQAEAD